MAIIQTVSECDFRDAFRAYNRTENFSHEGLGALFAYLDELSDDIGEPVELDVIALCCEWAEYPTALKAAAEYGATFDGDEEPEESALEWLRDRTTVIEHDAGILMVQF